MGSTPLFINKPGLIGPSSLKACYSKINPNTNKKTRILESVWEQFI